MESLWKSAVGRQFGAAVDMLENAIRACPADLWADESQHMQFWYIVYHALFWLDLYLSGSKVGFAPPAPFTLAELDPAGVLPDRAYTPDELLTYLAHCRAKLQTVIDSLTGEAESRVCKFGWGEPSFGELLIYNMRHVQDHIGELNLLLGQRTGSGPGWVSGVKRPSHP